MDVDTLEMITRRAYEAGIVSGSVAIGSALETYVADHDSARSMAVVGGAHLVRYKLGQNPADLLAALHAYERAHLLEPSPSRAANIAAALLELNDVPDAAVATGRADRHSRAVALLESALDRTDPTTSVWISRATTLSGALLDAVEDDLPGASVDQLLDTVGALVRAAENHPDRRAEPLTMLGCALTIAADRGHPRGDLGEAVRVLRMAVDLTPAPHIDRPARTSNLASALSDRYERTGRLVDLRAAVELHREALESLAAEEGRRGQVINNLANSLLAQYRHTWAEADLTSAAEILPLLIESFTVHHPDFAASRSNAGLIAREVAARRGDPGLLAQAIALHSESLEATPHGHPMRPGRLASLALSLMHRYERDDRDEDLDAALALGGAALDAEPGAPHERAIFLSSQGSAHHERFLRSGRIRDLEQAARLHLAAVDGIPRTSPFAAGMLNNAAVALNDRYERLGDPDDLAAALRALQDSVGVSADDASGDLAPRLNNLALTFHRTFEHTGELGALMSARRAADEAYEMATAAGSPAMRATTLGTRADVLATVVRETEDSSARTELDALWADPDLPRLRARPASAASWLLRRALQADAVTAAERRVLLHHAAETGARSRPAVALAAARQLAVDGLIHQVAGRGPGTAVEQAAELLRAALVVLQSDQDELRHALSWQSQMSGMAAVLAHSRLLVGDVDGATRAFEDGHAVLLGARLAPATGRRPAHTTVTVWATPVGGGAVVHSIGMPARGVPLPLLTTDAVSAWSRKLGKAARLGAAVLDRLLVRITSELTSALTGPLTDLLRAGEPVTWLSGGLIGLLPLSAARTVDGDLVGERHAMRHALTAALASWADRTAANRPLDAGGWLSIGSPTPSSYPALPGAAAEMAAFADADHRHAGRRATTDAVVHGLEVAPLVHIATHARVSAADPLMNHLLLAADEPLYADEVAHLASPARLVVLSACDTAAPGAAHADEGLGLPGAFHAAGVPGVIASRWSVGDQSTGNYMARVAAHLRDGLDPSTALHRAAQDARRGGSPASTWSAFGLWGS